VGYAGTCHSYVLVERPLVLRVSGRDPDMERSHCVSIELDSI